MPFRVIFKPGNVKLSLNLKPVIKIGFCTKQGKSYMNYKGGKAYYDDDTAVPEYKTEHGSAITGLGGGGGGVGALIAVVIAAMVAALAAPLILLLWFVFSGYRHRWIHPRKGNINTKPFRIIASMIAAVYAYIIAMIFLNNGDINDAWPIVITFGVITLLFILQYRFLPFLAMGILRMTWRIVTSKVAIALYVMATVFVGLNYVYKIEVNQLDNRENNIAYPDVAEDLTKKNFKSSFDARVDKRLNFLKELTSSIPYIVLSQLNEVFMDYLGYNYLELPAAKSIEGFRAKQKLAKLNHQPKLYLLDYELSWIMDNLGSLDKGYSKALAALIKDSATDEVIEDIGFWDEKRLKENHQISAYRVIKQRQKALKDKE